MGIDEACVVMEEWNETTQPYPTSATAPALFEAQASRTPDGVALVFEGVEVRYGELVTMTGRLAVRLVEGWGGHVAMGCKMLHQVLFCRPSTTNRNQRQVRMHKRSSPT